MLVQSRVPIDLSQLSHNAAVEIFREWRQSSRQQVAAAELALPFELVPLTPPASPDRHIRERGRGWPGRVHSEGIATKTPSFERIFSAGRYTKQRKSQTHVAVHIHTIVSNTKVSRAYIGGSSSHQDSMPVNAYLPVGTGSLDNSLQGRGRVWGEPDAHVCSVRVHIHQMQSGVADHRTIVVQGSQDEQEKACADDGPKSH